MSNRENAIRELHKEWAENPRWQGIKRDYNAEDVVNSQGKCWLMTMHVKT